MSEAHFNNAAICMVETLKRYALASADTPVLLMVSGGSDSTALAYLACGLHDEGHLGPVGIVHINHCLRAKASDADAAFVQSLASVLNVSLFSERIDVAACAHTEHGNLEAIARRERYGVAQAMLAQFCLQEGRPQEEGRIVTAHTADDRVETFYMRSIVGTGPGGFRSMRYSNGNVIHPLLGISRTVLRAYIETRAVSGKPVALDENGKLWREDATNADTDRFRAYVRHRIVPQAKERNPQLLETLCRTMDLIADEDDYLEEQTQEACGQMIVAREGNAFFLLPEFATLPVPLQRRAVCRCLVMLLDSDARISFASVDAVLSAFDQTACTPRSGYVANIQGDLAVSANKRGVLIEPMEAFRIRRKRK